MQGNDKHILRIRRGANLKYNFTVLDKTSGLENHMNSFFFITSTFITIYFYRRIYFPF